MATKSFTLVNNAADLTSIKSNDDRVVVTINGSLNANGTQQLSGSQQLVINYTEGNTVNLIFKPYCDSSNILNNYNTTVFGPNIFGSALGAFNGYNPFFPNSQTTNKERCENDAISMTILKDGAQFFTTGGYIDNPTVSINEEGTYSITSFQTKDDDFDNGGLIPPFPLPIGGPFLGFPGFGGYGDVDGDGDIDGYPGYGGYSGYGGYPGYGGYGGYSNYGGKPDYDEDQNNICDYGDLSELANDLADLKYKNREQLDDFDQWFEIVLEDEDCELGIDTPIYINKYKRKMTLIELSLHKLFPDIVSFLLSKNVLSPSRIQQLYDYLERKKPSNTSESRRKEEILNMLKDAGDGYFRDYYPDYPNYISGDWLEWDLSDFDDELEWDGYWGGYGWSNYWRRPWRSRYRYY
jgi:hypothetical protein